MATAMVRVDDVTHGRLKQIAGDMGLPMQAVVAEAVELLRRQQFLTGLNADFERLRQDKDVWEDELRERALWDVTLMDGIEPD